MLRFLIIAAMLAGTFGCPAGKGDPVDTGPAGGSCDWIRAETPTTVPDDEVVTVYCQETTDCLASDVIVTTTTVLHDAQTACEAADELNTWEAVPGACTDDSGLVQEAVRCWKQD